MSIVEQSTLIVTKRDFLKNAVAIGHEGSVLQGVFRRGVEAETKGRVRSTGGFPIFVVVWLWESRPFSCPYCDFWTWSYPSFFFRTLSEIAGRMLPSCLCPSSPSFLSFPSCPFPSSPFFLSSV